MTSLFRATCLHMDGPGRAAYDPVLVHSALLAARIGDSNPSICRQGMDAGLSAAELETPEGGHDFAQGAGQGAADMMLGI